MEIIALLAEFDSGAAGGRAGAVQGAAVDIAAAGGPVEHLAPVRAEVVARPGWARRHSAGEDGARSGVPGKPFPQCRPFQPEPLLMRGESVRRGHSVMVAVNCPAPPSASAE
jgi:hypothetical protein